MLIGSDQCFPACLPVDDREECIRIVRVEVEDGSLLEVTYALADAIVNTSIQDGTVFLLGSVSHLSKSGTQQYITDWIRSRLWLRNRFGEKCMVLHLFPVSAQGISSKCTVRSIIELLHWVMSLNDTEAVLAKKCTENYCNTYLGTTGGETDWANGLQCFRVPAGLDTKAYVSLVSEGWGNHPDCIPPLSQAAERGIVLSLISTRTNFKKTFFLF